MNLLDSHDTERLLWTLTPGAETTARQGARRGQRRRRQGSASGSRRSSSSPCPGAPTVYYGDEVGVTGDDDPDDRRTYPWADLGGVARHGDAARTTRSSPRLRRDLPVLTDGDFRALPTARRRRRGVRPGRPTSQAAIVVLNRGTSAPRTVDDARSTGTCRDGLAFTTRFALGSGGSAAASSDGRRRGGDGARRRRTACCATGPSISRRPPPRRLTLDAEGERPGGGLLERGAGRRRVRRLAQPGHRRRVRPVQSPRRSPAPTATIDGPAERQGRVRRRHGDGRRRQRLGALERGGRPAAPADRLGEHPVAAHADPHDQHGQPDRHRLRPGLDRRRDQRARADAEPARPAGLRAGGHQPGHASRLDLGRRGVQHRTPATTTSSWPASCPRRSGRSTTSTATPRPTGPSGCTRTSAGRSRPARCRRTRAMLTVNASGDTTAPADPDRPAPSSARRRPASSWRGTPSPATRRCSATRCERADADGGPYATIVRITTSTAYTDTDGRARAGPTGTACSRSTRRSTGRAPSAAVCATAELAHRDAPVHRDGAGDDGRHRALREHRRVPRPAGRQPPAVGPGRRGAHARRTRRTGRSTLTGKEGTQIEYKYALGRGTTSRRMPPAAEIANRQLTLAYGHHRHPDRQRHGRELAERRPLRQLNGSIRRQGPSGSAAVTAVSRPTGAVWSSVLTGTFVLPRGIPLQALTRPAIVVRRCYTPSLSR